MSSIIKVYEIDRRIWKYDSDSRPEYWNNRNENILFHVITYVLLLCLGQQETI